MMSGRLRKSFRLTMTPGQAKLFESILEHRMGCSCSRCTSGVLDEVITAGLNVIAKTQERKVAHGGR